MEIQRCAVIYINMHAKICIDPFRMNNKSLLDYASIFKRLSLISALIFVFSLMDTEAERIAISLQFVVKTARC